tara:strand:+ start:1416 stop:2156 length:741 start_codon:yes stop_codon:yes gene_type:complete
VNYRRNLSVGAPFGWLAAGARDLRAQPAPSLLYGLFVFLMSLAVILGMRLIGWDQVLFPALAGFMVLGPIVAVGLYEKSRRLARNEPVTLSVMIFVKAESGGQILFTGALLVLLMLLWMRAAVIIYALFFGLLPYPGLTDIVQILLHSPTGWAMLIVGSAVGALFASFAFAISIFSVPMLLDEDIDAFTAMGTSMALAWNNLPAMICWGLIVVSLFVFCIATGLLGLIVVFPLLGHASWHAYLAVR